MKKKKPSKQAGIPTKNESNNRDSKGKLIRLFNKSVNEWIESIEKRENELLKEEKEKLTHDQVKQIKTLLEQQKKVSKKLTPQRIKELLEVVRKNNEGKAAFRVDDDNDRRIYKNGLSPDKYLLWLEDRDNKNLENELENVETIKKLISKAKHGKHFERKHKKKANPKPKTEFTPLEKKLYKFCIKNRIDITKSADIIEVIVLDKGFKNLKGKSLLHRSTVSKMKKKIKENPSLKIDL